MVLREATPAFFMHSLLDLAASKSSDLSHQGGFKVIDGQHGCWNVGEVQTEEGKDWWKQQWGELVRVGSWKRLFSCVFAALPGLLPVSIAWFPLGFRDSTECSAESFPEAPSEGNLVWLRRIYIGAATALIYKSLNGSSAFRQSTSVAKIKLFDLLSICSVKYDSPGLRSLQNVVSSFFHSENGYIFSKGTMEKTSGVSWYLCVHTC